MARRADLRVFVSAINLRLIANSELTGILYHHQ